MKGGKKNDNQILLSSLHVEIIPPFFVCVCVFTRRTSWVFKKEKKKLVMMKEKDIIFTVMLLVLE